MPLPRPSLRSGRRLLAVAAATIAIASCDGGSTFAPNSTLWAFVNLGALRTPAGEHRVAPSAVFLRGEISSIPNAALRPDSCFSSQPYTPPTNTFTDVTYLDAGTPVTLTVGGVAHELTRTASAGSIGYGLGAGNTVAYRPGDSVVINIPGAPGGYPAFSARGKTAEPFTFTPVAPSPGATIPIRWTAATDGNSSLVISLQYTPPGATAKREIRCAFVDDGADSIPSRFHDAWSNAGNSTRDIVVTRLRTLITPVSNGAFEMISTYQVPTPTP